MHQAGGDPPEHNVLEQCRCSAAAFRGRTATRCGAVAPFAAPLRRLLPAAGTDGQLQGQPPYISRVDPPVETHPYCA